MVPEEPAKHTVHRQQSSTEGALREQIADILDVLHENTGGDKMQIEMVEYGISMLL